jgi:hypothetical protein
MANTQVTLTAVPTAGFAFTGWAGACGSAAQPLCMVTMDAAKEASAQFKPLKTLQVTKNTGGTINSAPIGIDCGAKCIALYPQGTVVELVANPLTNYAFYGWNGACSGSSSCRIDLASDQLASAYFSPIYPEPLTLFTVRIESPFGSVSSFPEGIDCGNKCLQAFTRNTRVKLLAKPAEGYRFIGWLGGGCSGRKLTCEVKVLRKPVLVKAKFAK